MSKIKFSVRMEVRERKRRAKMKVVERIVLMSVVAGARDAEQEVIRRAEAEGLVVGRVYVAQRLGVATVADEMRDMGVPSLFEVEP